MSIALTWKLCDPSESDGVVNGEVHATNAAESNEHWKVEVSLAVKPKLGVVTLLGFVGVELKFVFGATISTVHVYVAGEVSTLPAVSIALTWKLCDPSESDGVVNGEVHTANADESSEHWKVEVSLAVKPKLGVAAFDESEGVAVNDVSGAIVAILHVYVAGLASTLPAVSIALTWKLCDPSESDGVVNGEVHAANADESSEHWKVEVSLAVKLRLGVVTLLGFVGYAVIVVSGAVVSGITVFMIHV